MISALIGALRVSLGMDTAEFEAGTKRARAQARATATDIQSQLGGISNSLKALATGAVATALVAAGKRALDYASSLGEVAQQLGVTTRDLQAYRYAASQVGVSQDEMDKGLAKLTRTIGEAAAGSKSQATAFREIGVSLTDANGRLLSTGDILPRVADGLAKIKDPATRARVEVDLFGKAGQKLDTLLSGGSAAINELRDAASKLGIVLSDRQIQQADETADKLASIKLVLEARLAGVVSDNAKAILTLASAFERLAAGTGDAINALRGAANVIKNEGVLAFLNRTPGELAQIGNVQGNVQLRLREANDARKAYQEAKQRNQGGVWDQIAVGGYSGVAQKRSDMRAADAALERAIAASRAEAQSLANASPAPTPSTGGLPTVSGGGGGKGRSGPSAADRADNRAKELAAIDDELLSLRQQLTTDVREQARLEHDRLAAGEARRIAEIELAVAERKLTPAAAEEIKVREARLAEIRHSLVNLELDNRLDREDAELRRAGYDTQIEALRAQSRLAKAAGERRDIELRILDLQYDRERAELEALLASRQATDAEKQIARARLGMLDQMKRSEVADVQRQTMGPMERYFDSVNLSAAETRERLEEIAVQGLGRVNDGLAEAATRFLKLKGFAGQLFNQMISDVIRFNIASASKGSGGILGGLIGLGSRLFGGSSAISAGLSRTVSNIGADAAAVRAPVGWASGGSGIIGGLSGIDRNVLSLNGMPVANVSRGEMLSVTPANDTGGRLHIVPSPLFNVVMEQSAANVAAPMAIASGAHARQAAGADMAKATRRRIPGRG